MAAQAKFTTKQLHGLDSNQLQDLLWREHGINWNDYRDEVKRGWIVTRAVRTAPVSYVDGRTGATVETTAERRFWDVSAAPNFAAGYEFP